MRRVVLEVQVWHVECPVCAKTFETRSHRGTFCSDRCRLVAHRKRQKKGAK